MASLTWKPPPRWRQKLAASVLIEEAELRELRAGAGAERAMDRLRERLHEDAAVPLGPVEVHVSRTHLRPSTKVAFLAEVDALLLRHPNPIPPIDLFPRPIRAVRRWWNLTFWHGRVGPFAVSFNPSSINLPRLRGGWASEDDAWAAVEWGNGNSDPVWSVEADFRPRSRVLRRVVDWFERR